MAKEDIRVVLVDDDVDACEALSELLREDGYSVRFATNAKDAVTAVREYQPVCALVDLGLPVTMDEADAALKTAFQRVFGPVEDAAPPV